MLETVQDALLADRQLEVEYRKFDAEESSKLTLHPLGLVQRGPAIYLVATAFDYQDVRLYALHRFQAATKTGNPVKLPESFTLDAHISGGALQFGNGSTLRLEAALSDGLAQILRETPLSEDQQIEVQDGVINLTATVADSWQLRWWILSQGDGIEVTAPGSLREEIALSLKQAAEQYAG